MKIQTKRVVVKSKEYLLKQQLFNVFNLSDFISADLYSWLMVSLSYAASQNCLWTYGRDPKLERSLDNV